MSAALVVSRVNSGSFNSSFCNLSDRLYGDVAVRRDKPEEHVRAVMGGAFFL